MSEPEGPYTGTRSKVGPLPSQSEYPDPPDTRKRRPVPVPRRGQEVPGRGQGQLPTVSTPTLIAPSPTPLDPYFLSNQPLEFIQYFFPELTLEDCIEVKNRTQRSAVILRQVIEGRKQVLESSDTDQSALSEQTQINTPFRDNTYFEDTLDRFMLRTGERGDTANVNPLEESLTNQFQDLNLRSREKRLRHKVCCRFRTGRS